MQRILFDEATQTMDHLSIDTDDDDLVVSHDTPPMIDPDEIFATTEVASSGPREELSVEYGAFVNQNVNIVDFRATTKNFVKFVKGLRGYDSRACATTGQFHMLPSSRPL